MIHQLEEYLYPGGFREWMNQSVFGSDDIEQPLSKRAAFIFNVPLGWTLFAAVAFFGSGQLWLTLPAMSILFVNAWFHIISSIILNKYSPGTNSAIILLLPITTYGYSFVLITWQVEYSLLMTSLMVGLIYHMFVIMIPRRWMKNDQEELEIASEE